MPDAPSFFVRFAVAQMAGLLLGLVGYVLVGAILPDADPMLRWGVLLWYPTLAAVIALAGAAVPERERRGRLCWWVRGLVIGIWMNLLAVFLTADEMHAFLVAAFGPDPVLASHWWFVPGGAAAGLVIGYLVFRFGGAGRELLDD